MLPLGVDARNYTLFGHSLHSTLQASTCLYEAMPSYSTPYPGAPLSPLFYILGTSHKGLTHQGRHNCDVMNYNDANDPSMTS